MLIEFFSKFSEMNDSQFIFIKLYFFKFIIDVVF